MSSVSSDDDGDIKDSEDIDMATVNRHATTIQPTIEV